MTTTISQAKYIATLVKQIEKGDCVEAIQLETGKQLFLQFPCAVLFSLLTDCLPYAPQLFALHTQLKQQLLHWQTKSGTHNYWQPGHVQAHYPDDLDDTCSILGCLHGEVERDTQKKLLHAQLSTLQNYDVDLGLFTTWCGVKKDPSWKDIDPVVNSNIFWSFARIGAYPLGWHTSLAQAIERGLPSNFYPNVATFLFFFARMYQELPHAVQQMYEKTHTVLQIYYQECCNQMDQFSQSCALYAQARLPFLHSVLQSRKVRMRKNKIGIFCLDRVQDKQRLHVGSPGVYLAIQLTNRVQQQQQARKEQLANYWSSLSTNIVFSHSLLPPTLIPLFKRYTQHKGCRQLFLGSMRTLLAICKKIPPTKHSTTLLHLSVLYSAMDDFLDGQLPLPNVYQLFRLEQYCLSQYPLTELHAELCHRLATPRWRYLESAHSPYSLWLEYLTLLDTRFRLKPAAKMALGHCIHICFEVLQLLDDVHDWKQDRQEKPSAFLFQLEQHLLRSRQAGRSWVNVQQIALTIIFPEIALTLRHQLDKCIQEIAQINIPQVSWIQDMVTESRSTLSRGIARVTALTESTNFVAAMSKNM